MLKSTVKALASRILGRSAVQALVPALSAEIVSFDIFDTLILRKCSTPQDVFTLAEEKYNSLGEARVRSFRESRVKAESSVRKKSRYDEITFDEIYDELAGYFGQEFTARMKALELEAEFEAVLPNDELKEFYDLLRERQKRIIITSDMYLPSEVIKKILQKCGYFGYESLYVSSEFRLSKSRGSLFRKVLEDKSIAASKILHIGDNVKSDWFIAKREGLKSFLYRRLPPA